MIAFTVLLGVAWAATGPAMAQQACDAPGHMLIVGGTENPAQVPPAVRERAKGYGPAVEALIKSYGASYIVRGRPFRIVEGTWPDWKGVVASTWPCRQTGQVFWHSEKYQNEVKPLREGASSYHVAMFGPPARHPRQTGQWTAEGGPAAKGIVCDNPVYFLVLTDVKDAAKLAAYRGKLADTAIQYDRGAEDVLVGSPVEDLEGGWPEALSAKMTRWPCLAAFEAYYNAPQYQNEIKPLREGAADFTAVLIEAVAPAN
jgi:uncharacterized protein (DUF1330 family)